MSNNNEPTTFEEAFECYIEYRRRFECLENEFDEYQQSSLNYEQELEVQLKQLDDQIHRLQHDLFLERTQNEQYREHNEQQIKEFNKCHDQMQDELNACKNLNEKLTHYIRELEQTNDDLERSKRTLFDSLSTFETKLNRALEQNALLENELDEKQQLTETVQRLRDETRDLREEVNVLQKTHKEKLNKMPSHRMKSILSEAASVSETSSTYDSCIPQEVFSPDLSTSKPLTLSRTNVANRTMSISNETRLTKGNDFCQPLSNSIRLQSLKLINEAFRHFTAIESTLSMQRKQSQITSSSIYSNRSRFNSTTNSNYNESTIT